MVFRVEGRNIGDEGFGGANVRNMETGRMDKDAAAFLSETIRKTIAPIEYSVKTNKVAIALTAKNMAEAIKDNTQDFQEIIQENGQDTQDQLLKLLTMMSDAQKRRGDASVLAIKDVIKQIEKIKASDTSGRLTETLGLDKQQKDLSKQIGRQTVFGAAFKKFTNVDLRTESAMSALSPTKLFGLDPGAGNVIADQKAQLASERATGNLASIGEKLLENKKEKIAKPAAEKNAEGGQVFTSGIDRESLDNKQVELLEQILAQLKDMGGGLGAIVTPALLTSIVSAAKTLLLVGTGAAAITKAIDWWTNYNQSDYDEFANRPENIGKSEEELAKDLRVDLGIDSRASDPDFDMTQEPGYALLKAKRTGLYDKDYMGNSEVDLKKLAETNDPAQLQAILDDNDISDTTRMQVERRINQINREGNLGPVRPSMVPSSSNSLETPAGTSEPSFLPGPGSLPLLGAGVLSLEAQGLKPKTNGSLTMNIPGRDVLSFAAGINFEDMITPAVSPTADAVGNMSNLIEKSIQNAVNNIFNTTNNNYNGSSGDQFVISAQRTRNTDSSFRFYQQGQNTR